MHIISKHSGKCLDVTDSGSADGTKIQQRACAYGSSQTFQIRIFGDSYQILAMNSKCLDVVDGSSADCASVQLRACSGAPNQSFRIEARANGAYSLAAAHSGKVLDVTDRSQHDGAQIQQWTDFGADNQSFLLQPATAATAGLASLLSEAQFNQMFPDRIPFYTYSGLVEAADANSKFVREGSLEIRKREVAAILANAAHESDQFRAVREYNQANWPKYCDNSNTVSPCAPGQQYYGRGPIQLSWNYNYDAAGKYLGLPLLQNPDLVATNSKVAFQTMIWFWMTQNGAGTMTAHSAIVDEKGFGETIRSINGALECNGGPGAPEVQRRIEYFKRAAQILGVTVGNRLDC